MSNQKESQDIQTAWTKISSQVVGTVMSAVGIGIGIGLITDGGPRSVFGSIAAFCGTLGAVNGYRSIKRALCNSKVDSP